MSNNTKSLIFTSITVVSFMGFGLHFLACTDAKWWHLTPVVVGFASLIISKRFRNA